MPDENRRVREFKQRMNTAYPDLQVNIWMVSFSELGRKNVRFVAVRGNYNLDAFYQIREWCRDAGLILQQQDVLERIGEEIKHGSNR